MDDNEKKRDEIKEDIGKYDWGLFIAIGVGVFLFFLTLCFPCIQNKFWKLTSTGKAGEFGDQFGSLNTLFSGLAFTALIYTIYLQRRDLKMQQEELRLQQEVQERAKKEFERQTLFFQKENENAEKQRFDAFFFNSLNIMSENKKVIENKCCGDGMTFSLEDIGGYILNKLIIDSSNEKNTICKERYIFEGPLMNAKSVISAWAYSIIMLAEEISNMKQEQKRIVFGKIILESLTVKEKVCLFWFILIINNTYLINGVILLAKQDGCNVINYFCNDICLYRVGIHMEDLHDELKEILIIPKNDE